MHYVIVILLLDAKNGWGCSLQVAGFPFVTWYRLPVTRGCFRLYRSGYKFQDASLKLAGGGFVACYQLPVTGGCFRLYRSGKKLQVASVRSNTAGNPYVKPATGNRQQKKGGQDRNTAPWSVIL
jgi:hypothetical protein